MSSRRGMAITTESRTTTRGDSRQTRGTRGREERLRQEKLEQERQIWQERLHAEIKEIEKKLELET